MEVSSTAVAVTESSQAGHVRRLAAALAGRLGFSAEDQGRVALVASEVAKNLVAHAREGQVLLRELYAGSHVGVELIALDKGPGMEDVQRCLEDGYSTAGTAGKGLGAIRRQSNLFDLYSRPEGTAVLAQVWAGRPPPDSPWEVGAVCLPMPGQEVSGDAWAITQRGPHLLALVADGLGHGPVAARASRAAVMALLREQEGEPVALLGALHRELHSTRGAAVALAELSTEGSQLHYAGVGNISAAVIAPQGTSRLVSMVGTLGHMAPRMQQFSYPWSPGSALLMHSDGLTAHWRLQPYPGLLEHHPSLVAGVLYRDFNRGRDDATVVVLRERGRGRLH